MRNGNGFTLLEVVTALVIFSILAAVFVPISLFVMEEKRALSLQRTANNEMREALQLWLYDGQLPVDFGPYRWEHEMMDEQTLQLCLAWKAKERNYSFCEAAKR